DAAIDKGRDWLMGQLKGGLPDMGNWGWVNSKQTLDGLVVYALLTAGVPNGDAEIIKAVLRMRAEDTPSTYGAAIRAQALHKFDPAKLYVDIRNCAQYLVDNQAREGYWGYGQEVRLPAVPKITLTPSPSAVATGSRGGRVSRKAASNTAARRRTVISRKGWGKKNDNSNTQYAMLGFAATMSAGIYPPPDCCELLEKWLTDCQNTDGGWGYAERGTPMHGGEASYGSMTAGGISSLSIVLRFHKNQDPRKDVRVQKGLRWLGDRLTFDTNPGKGSWHYYWIYSVERAGSFAGTQWFGDRPWYYEGATYLLGDQKEDGSWGGGDERNKILNTCWAILFLKQASRNYVYSLDTHK
ncbi:MAG: prenyltransferase/squalene oxidase repeat-containing protein, partial [Planctomycetota bacterium]